MYCDGKVTYEELSYEELSTASRKVILDDLFSGEYSQNVAADGREKGGTAAYTVTYRMNERACRLEPEDLDFIERTEALATKYEQWLALQRRRGAVILNNQLIYWPPRPGVVPRPVLLCRPMRFFAGLMSPSRGRH